jgi:hypothetical protein
MSLKVTFERRVAKPAPNAPSLMIVDLAVYQEISCEKRGTALSDGNPAKHRHFGI